MSQLYKWNVQPASDALELAEILNVAASGIKTQVIASPVFAEPRFLNIKDRLSAIADELTSLQVDIAMC